uniref:Uncharacterized protein n=1 Tax=Aegilops tauschii subsp. strangulata TaxID=200361 RepID=A0A453HXH1_AEGTS
MALRARSRPLRHHAHRSHRYGSRPQDRDLECARPQRAHATTPFARCWTPPAPPLCACKKLKWI